MPPVPHILRRFQAKRESNETLSFRRRIREWGYPESQPCPPSKRSLRNRSKGNPKSPSSKSTAPVCPPGDVLVRVHYSDLNYKDGLAVTGRPGVIRKYPMVPGVDLAGVVEESSSPDWKPGDEVVVTGFGLSETAWGGYAELARVNADWLVGLPKGLTLKQSMAIGTAGFTAMQCVVALEQHGLVPDSSREVLVTGAAGGVGSIAVAILAKLGYRVAASTGRAELGDYLRSLGASEIVDRSVLTAPSKRPMESERWAGAVDSVGGDTLAGDRARRWSPMAAWPRAASRAARHSTPRFIRSSCAA